MKKNLDDCERVIFWLSFGDPDRPKGEQFLGVSIVEVSKLDAIDERADLMARFGQVRPNADWISAAIRKAWRLGINPGGAVAAAPIPEKELPPDLPIDCALTSEQIARYGEREDKP